MKPVVALDFDGVICDSMDECLLTAYNACHRFQGSSAWADDVSKLDPGFVTRFRRLRYLVRPAQEYWLLVHWLYTYTVDLDQSRFDALKVEYSNVLAKFEPVFFEARCNLRAANPTMWSALHRLYPEFVDGWDRVRTRCSMHVVTTKDALSVQHFNQLWGLGIERDRLWTKERMCSKPSAIQQIARWAGCPPTHVVFVDDHPDHLREVSATGAQCYWAAWGYTPANMVNLRGDFRRLGSLAELPY